jgi:hypothetical protein
MADAHWENTLRHLKRIVQFPCPNALSDREMLDRFVQGHDETAYDLLVQRHGLLVKGV